MTSTEARIEVLSAAVQAIAATLSPDRAEQAAEDFRERVGAMAERPMSTEAAAAVAAELTRLLGALGALPRIASTVATPLRLVG